jgi:hypothetical protein
MMRAIPALLGLGLATLWIIGMSVDATIWLTWCCGIAAALSFATVGIIPERQSSAWAALCLGALAAGLFAAWIVGLARHATGWLTWWTFVAACATGAVALGAARQGALELLRTRDTI